MRATLLYKRACKQALTDIYFDLGTCDKLIRQHPDWEWVKDKKTELEAKEAELSRSLYEQITEK